MYFRINLFWVEVLENLNLNGRGLNKEICYVELFFEGFGLIYESGDSFGVYLENDLEFVELFFKEMNWDLEEIVMFNK